MKGLPGGLPNRPSMPRERGGPLTSRAEISGWPDGQSLTGNWGPFYPGFRRKNGVGHCHFELLTAQERLLSSVSANALVQRVNSATASPAVARLRQQVWGAPPELDREADERFKADLLERPPPARLEKPACRSIECSSPAVLGG